MPSAVIGRVAISPLAGEPAPQELHVDVARLEREYYEQLPDPGDPNQMVSFGANGHRGSPPRGNFTEAHILAITQAICDHRRSEATEGLFYMGKDTQALSGPFQRTALEVLAANGVETVIQQSDGVAPTPVISRAILVFNRSRRTHVADASSSRPHTTRRRMADSRTTRQTVVRKIDVTGWVDNRANELLEQAVPALNACRSRRQ